MNLFFGSSFWGILLILIGASMILRGFNINIPIVKIFIAIVVILFGVKLLIGGFGIKSFTSTGVRSSIYTSHEKEYAMIFSSGEIDLRNMDENAGSIEVTAVFGNALVTLPSDLAFEFDTTAVFGACILPDNRVTSFGSEKRSINTESNSKKVRVEASAVFGRVEFRFADSPQKPVNEEDTKTSEF